MPPGSPTRHQDDDTGVPGLRTWGRVYAAVVVCFVTWIALLTWLMREYS
jgi:hypothetical protein